MLSSRRPIAGNSCRVFSIGYFLQQHQLPWPAHPQPLPGTADAVQGVQRGCDVVSGERGSGARPSCGQAAVTTNQAQLTVSSEHSATRDFTVMSPILTRGQRVSIGEVAGFQDTRCNYRSCVQYSLQTYCLTPCFTFCCCEAPSAPQERPAECGEAPTHPPLPRDNPRRQRSWRHKVQQEPESFHDSFKTLNKPISNAALPTCRRG